MVIIGLLNTKILINQNTDLKFASLIGMGIFLEDKKMSTKYCTLNLVSLEMIQEADTFFLHHFLEVLFCFNAVLNR